MVVVCRSREVRFLIAIDVEDLREKCIYVVVEVEVLCMIVRHRVRNVDCCC